MLEQVKKTAMNGAMKVMQHPTVSRIMSNPHVMNAMTKGFELHSQLRSRVEGTIRTVRDRIPFGPGTDKQEPTA